jgi:bifunctional non-homologous end joining protein LigD
VSDLPADANVFKAMLAAGLKIEGVVAKRKASAYQPGVRSPDWMKIKRPGWQEGRNWTG